MSSWGQIVLQNSNSPLMGHIEEVYDWLMLVIIMIVSLVFYVSVWALKSKDWDRSLLGNERLEILWIVLPAMVLSLLAFPSLSCLYVLEEISNPLNSIKVTGRQWFWSYELPSPPPITPEDEAEIPDLDTLNDPVAGYGKSPRLLGASSALALPFGAESRLTVSSSDVIHSWALPSFGVKVDAIPGRLNQLSLQPAKLGAFYGQCSEICGANHSFMPVKVDILPWLSWLGIFN